MSLDVLNEVWTAEMAFLRDMYLLDADFFRFVWGLLQQPEAAGPATATLAVHAGTKVCVCVFFLFFGARVYTLLSSVLGVACVSGCCCAHATTRRGGWLPGFGSVLRRVYFLL